MTRTTRRTIWMTLCLLSKPTLKVATAMLVLFKQGRQMGSFCLRQEKLGKGGGDGWLKPFVGTLQEEASCPAKLATAGSESCVVVE